MGFLNKVSAVINFVQETHWGITGVHYGVIGDAAREIPANVPWHGRIAGISKRLSSVGTPWWEGMPRQEVDRVVNALMRSNSVAWVGEMKDLPLDAEFARHIGHLAEYAPLDS